MSSETSAVNVHGAWSAKRLTLLAMMLALISVSSYIAIPLPFSDAKITAQTMIVNLIGLLIAPQDTILVMASWLLLGLCGVPVFSGGSAGPGKLLGPSGGYYIGFLVVAFLISLFCRKWKKLFTNPTFCSKIYKSMRINAFAVFSETEGHIIQRKVLSQL